MDLRRVAALIVAAAVAAACGGSAATDGATTGSIDATVPTAPPTAPQAATPAATSPESTRAQATASESAPPLGEGLTEFDARPPHADEPSPLEPSEPFGLAALDLEAPDGRAVRVPVYVAFDGTTRQRGLMHREELAADAGMVFLFPEERSGGFWMKDTLIPLSILYYGPEGDVRAVLDMEPCEEDPCPVYDPEVPYVGALEVNQGFYDEIGLDTTWRVVLPAGLPDAT